MSQDLLSVNKLSLSYEGKRVLKNVSLKLNAGEILCILGESGCGKTSLLRCIQGLQDYHKGKVVLDQKEVYQPHEVLVPGDDRIATVFQDFQLQEGLTVENNLKHEVIHLSKTQQGKSTNKCLRSCQLFEKRKFYPRAISGGQRQKLALAKAIINEPSLVLLDEPFSNIDHISKLGFQGILKELKEQGLSFIYVTHDVHDALSFSDRLLLLNEGKIELDCPTGQVFKNIRTTHQAKLFGLENIFEGAQLAKVFKLKQETAYYYVPSHAIRFDENNGVKLDRVEKRNLGKYWKYELYTKECGVFNYYGYLDEIPSSVNIDPNQLILLRP